MTTACPGVTYEVEYQAPDTPVRLRRERIATAIMTGLASSPDLANDLTSYNLENSTNEEMPEYVAGVAVEWTDALIAELDK